MGKLFGHVDFDAFLRWDDLFQKWRTSHRLIAPYLPGEYFSERDFRHFVRVTYNYDCQPCVDVRVYDGALVPTLAVPLFVLAAMARSNILPEWFSDLSIWNELDLKRKRL